MNSNTLHYLLQNDVRQDFVAGIGTSQWQTVFQTSRAGEVDWGVFCALLAPEYAPKALDSCSWDLLIGEGLPGFSVAWDKKKEVVTYHRYGGNGEVRPFILARSFHDAFPDTPEVIEEFRHIFNLATDAGRGLLLDFDGSGHEVEVARISRGLVCVELKYLLRFLAVTRLHLAVYIECVRYSPIEMNNIPEEKLSQDVKNDRMHLSFSIHPCDFVDGAVSFSRTIGKVVIPPPPIETCGVWPYDRNEAKEETTFIIGVDTNGDPIVSTSDPVKLDNYHGANPGSAHYVTPVFFRREVLSKYYADSDRYEVTDGYITCLSLWGMRIDNNHPSHVVAFLGDLGRDLPYSERLHWKQFNVSPAGRLSEVSVRRNFLAEFTDPEAPDLVFRTEYERLSVDWRARYGWPLFSPLAPGDAHLVRAVRIPVTNSQGEVDEQVLVITKLLIDYINEKGLVQEVGKGPEGEKGISKLDRFLVKRGLSGSEDVIQFLRDLQALRSSGSGHRKGRQYREALAKFNVTSMNKGALVVILLGRAIAMMRVLRQHFLPNTSDK